MGKFFVYFCTDVIHSWLLPVRRACVEEDLELFSVPVDENACVYLHY